MKKENHKSFTRYFGRVTKDLYTIMPAEITAVLVIKVIYAVTAFVQVYVTADLFDAAGNYLSGTADGKELLYRGGVFILLLALPMLVGMIEKPIVDIGIFQKHHMMIHKLLAHIVSLPLTRFEDSQVQNEIWRAKMCVYNSGLINYFYGFMDFVPCIVQFVGMFGVLASYDIRFVPLALLSAVPAFISNWIYHKKQYLRKRRQTPLMRRRDYLWRVLTERDTVKELRTMQTEDYLKARWTTVRDEVMEQDFSFEWKSSNIFLFCDLLRLAGVASSIALAICFAGSGIISIGQFAACIAAFGSMQSMGGQLVSLIAAQDNRANFAGDYYDFFDYAPETSGETPFRGFTGAISVRNVSFTYPAGKSEVLHDVSFDIRKGERVVIVGENGSGKTTLSKIISGVYQPGAGEVLYDGGNVRDFESGSFYRHFSVISQNFVKYQLTMRENIGISAPGQIHNDEKLMQSAKAADADSVVRRIGGLDAQLGREFDGAELSGGEWQKIAIARGLNKDADLIILDEPTSALDPLVEYDILKKFIDLTQGKTSLIISHRVGLCRFADRIIVMQNGCVVGNGTHDELLRNNAEYARIWKEQAKWYEG